MPSGLYEQLKNENALPSPTGVVLKLLRLAGDEDSTVEAIAATIESDPALAARVLKLVNSPIAGTSRRIGSVSRAVVLLGLRTLKHLALSISLISNHRTGRCENFDFTRFWRESVARAVSAQHLFARLGGLPADEAFTLGLLGKIGQLALAVGCPEQYARALARARADDIPGLLEIEREIFGTDHNDLSADMMSGWHVPDALCEIVRKQDAADWRGTNAVAPADVTRATLRLASLIAAALNRREADPDLAAGLEHQAGLLGLTAAELSRLMDAVREEWLETTAMFLLKPDQTSEIEQARVGSYGRAYRQSDVVSPTASEKNARPAGGDSLRILVVEDDPDQLALLTKHLGEAGYRVMTASNGAEAICVDLAQAPQMIITDCQMPGIDGLELCRRLRSQEGAELAYIIMLTGYLDRTQMVEALNAGADDVLSKPYGREELLARVRAGQRVVRLKASLAARALEVSAYNVKLSAYNDRLQVMASQDELTGLFNRREAMLSLAEHWALSVRQNSPLSCVMVDIDRFKRINDRYGHRTGDLVLVETANRLRSTVRAGEKLCRFGGEEFLIVCPGSSAEASRRLAERLRKAVASSPIKARGDKCNVTISLGVAERDEEMSSSDDLLAAADAALYAAKRAGRNRVHVAGPRERDPAGKG
ncbi:MAG TPA: HDOD domain-containing protein [Phycisphaerae bacterium]|nr:HDOD domain-containing protein [Phycisphaerae bacterium]